jgi:hypothetical protein
LPARHWADRRSSHPASWTAPPSVAAAHFPTIRSVPSVASVHTWAGLSLQV